MMNDYDRYFFGKDKDGNLAMVAKRVNDANVRSRGRVLTVTQLEDSMSAWFVSETGLLSVTEVRAMFKRLPLKKVFPSSYMQCAH